MNHKLNCILLVDDDDTTNLLNNHLLMDTGSANHIKIHQSTDEALNYITESAKLLETPNPLPYPDLILLDITMPEKDGFKFVEEYKALKKTLPHTPVLIMHTSSSDPDQISKALNMPEVADITNKPLTPEMIHSIFDKYFHLHI